MRLVQAGSQVTGAYTYADPGGCGTETGTVTGTITAGTLTFTAAETGCAGVGGFSGSVMLSADGSSFAGDWNGTRTGP